MEDIFSKHIPMVFKATDREERKVFVQLHMTIQSNKHDSKKELIVKLTDDQDLLFLYALRLAEEDFQSLKMQQGLLVDFIAFPQKFVDLLEMCIKENYKESPKFVIHFVSGGGSILGGDGPSVFNIVETNPFRHLNHLSLKFLPGSDADIKSHLASCLKQMKEANNVIQYKFEHTSKELNCKLQETQELLTSKTTELESLKLEWSSRIADITSKHKEDTALEKDKTVQFQASLQIQFDRERRELEQAHSKRLKQLEARLEEYESNNKNLTDHKYKSESSIRDYKSRISTMGEEYNRVKADLHALREENASLESTRHEKDKLTAHLQTRVAVLEQELKDKAEVLTKSNDLLGAEKDQKKHLETEMEIKQKEISKLDLKVKAMTDELKKGNEIIEKLQGGIKAYRDKVKVCTRIATEQEKLLKEKDSELEKLRQDLATTKDKLRDSEEKNQKLSTNLDTATQKLEESRKLLKNNENMIHWLNKQINEQRVNQNLLGNFELAASTQPRPTGTMHNYSTSSHGSALSHSLESMRLQAVQRAPGAAPVGSQLSGSDYPVGNATVNNQMSANVGSSVFRKSGIPVAQSQSISSTPPNTGGEKEKNPPLDPKFLMKRDEAIPVRGILNYNIANSKPTQPLSTVGSVVPQTPNLAAASSSGPSVAPKVSSAAVVGHADIGSVRLSQQMIVPKHQPPLASAYFPAQS